jgi:hypothetical protein
MKQITKLALLASTFALGACGGSSDSSGPVAARCSDCAVVTSVAADYGSSGIDFVQTNFPFETQTGFAAQDLSDIGAATYGDYFYRLGRFQQDNISKWSFESPDSPLWEFSVGTYANPYDVIFVSDSKAYILLWGDNKILIVNPNVTGNTEEADFSTGEIDLSAYDLGAGSNTAAAILHEGYLYVVLEGFNAAWEPTQSHLIKIDTMSDTEVDVNGAAEGKGYALMVKNAGEIERLDQHIFVSGKGRYKSPSEGRPEPELSGGIEKVDISSDTFSSSLLIDDNHENVAAQITAIEIASANIAYLLRYNDWQNNDIIKFNPQTGEVDDQPLAGYEAQDIRFIEVDAHNQLWIGLGSSTAPRIDIVSTIDDSLIGTAALTRNPAAIAFADTTN